MASKQQKFISHSFGDFLVRDLFQDAHSLPTSRCVFTWQKGSFYRDTNTILGVSTLTTCSPSKGPPPHTITVGVMFSAHEFSRDTFSL